MGGGVFLLPCSAVQRAHIHSEGVGVGILNLKESEAKKKLQQHISLLKRDQEMKNCFSLKIQAMIIQNLKSQSFQIKKSKISLVIFNLKYQHFRFSFQVFLGILEKKSIKCQKNLKRKSKMLIFQIVDDKKHILEK